MELKTEEEDQVKSDVSVTCGLSASGQTQKDSAMMHCL